MGVQTSPTLTFTVRRKTSELNLKLVPAAVVPATVVPATVVPSGDGEPPQTRTADLYVHMYVTETTARWRGIALCPRSTQVGASILL